MTAGRCRIALVLAAVLTVVGATLLTPVAKAAPGDIHLGLAKDLAPGGGDDPANSSWPSQLTTVGSTLFFTADHPTYGNELFRTTAAGRTSVVKNVVPGTGGSYPQQLTAVGSTLFFSAVSATGDRELWKSDGTKAGTLRVANINNVPTFSNTTASSNPLELTDGNGTLYFTAVRGLQLPGDAQPMDYRELWKSDGTAGGTKRVRNLLAVQGSGYPASLTDVNGTLYFTTRSPQGPFLWKSDGTSAGTVRVKGGFSEPPINLTAVSGLLYFAGTTTTRGRELWRSDGTKTGTTIVRDIVSSSAAGSGDPSALTAVGSTLYFAAYDDLHGTELWKSDGTRAGTRMVRDIDQFSSSSPSDLVAYNGALYFVARTAGTAELYRSTGTSAGTTMVKDLNGPFSGSPVGLTVSGGYLFMRASTGIGVDQLVRSDGTAGGTFGVGTSDTVPGLPAGLTDFNGTLYYADFTPEHGVELWRATIEP